MINLKPDLKNEGVPCWEKHQFSAPLPYLSPVDAQMTADQRAAHALDLAERVRCRLSVISTTKTYDPVQKEISEGARVPAVLLAAGVAENWWPLLYEPQKRQGDRLFEARHRLDALTRGYAFPPLGIWSGGDTVMASLFRPDTRFQQQQFLLPDQRDPWALGRTEVETALRAFIGAFIAETISRLGSRDKNLHETWRRICASEQDPAERE